MRYDDGMNLRMIVVRRVANDGGITGVDVGCCSSCQAGTNWMGAMSGGGIAGHGRIMPWGLTIA